MHCRPLVPAVRNLLPSDDSYRQIPKLTPGYDNVRQGLLREQHLANQLRHRNVLAGILVQEHESGLTVRYLDPPGTTLTTLVASLERRGEALPFEVAAHIVLSVARGASHVHQTLERPIGCLTMDHVHVSDDGEVRLWIQHLRLGQNPPMIRDRAYLPPEWASVHGHSMQGDVYGLGMMLFGLLSGRRPQAWPEVPINWLEEEGVPSSLIDIVARATHQDPTQRYQSAEAVTNDLRLWLATHTIPMTPPVFAAFLQQNGVGAQLFSEPVTAIDFDPSPTETLRPEPPLQTPFTHSSWIAAAALGLALGGAVALLLV